MSTNWKRLYGPTITPDSSAHVILSAGTIGLVLTKFTVSNSTATAATCIIAITPSGGALAQVYERAVPGFPVQGGIMEVVELEGHILNPGDTVTFTDATGTVLTPMISGVQYTP